MHSIECDAQSRNLPHLSFYVPITLLCYNVFTCLCVKMGTTGCVSNICPVNTIHMYNSLKTKICPHNMKQASHSFSHLNTVLLCVQSVLHIKEALVTGLFAIVTAPVVWLDLIIQTGTKASCKNSS